MASGNVLIHLTVALETLAAYSVEADKLGYTSVAAYIKHEKLGQKIPKKGPPVLTPAGKKRRALEDYKVLYATRPNAPNIGYVREHLRTAYGAVFAPQGELIEDPEQAREYLACGQWPLPAKRRGRKSA